jgi:hypothetical protein
MQQLRSEGGGSRSLSCSSRLADLVIGLSGRAPHQDQAQDGMDLRDSPVRHSVSQDKISRVVCLTGNEIARTNTEVQRNDFLTLTGSQSVAAWNSASFSASPPVALNAAVGDRCRGAGRVLQTPAAEIRTGE